MLNNLSDFIGFLEILDLFHTTLHNTAKLRSVYVEQHRPNSRIILDKSQISPLFKSKQTKKFNGLRNAQWLSESFRHSRHEIRDLENLITEFQYQNTITFIMIVDYIYLVGFDVFFLILLQEFPDLKIEIFFALPLNISYIYFSFAILQYFLSASTTCSRIYIFKILLLFLFSIFLQFA